MENPPDGTHMAKKWPFGSFRKAYPVDRRFEAMI